LFKRIEDEKAKSRPSKFLEGVLEVSGIKPGMPVQFPSSKWKSEGPREGHASHSFRFISELHSSSVSLLL
jgi:hypothetical protein